MTPVLDLSQVPLQVINQSKKNQMTEKSRLEKKEEYNKVVTEMAPNVSALAKQFSRFTVLQNRSQEKVIAT